MRTWLLGSLLCGMALALAACGAGVGAVTVTETIQAPSEGGVVPSVIGLHEGVALKMLEAARFGVLPVPTVPRGARATKLAVVYKQIPLPGTSVSRRLVTIFVRPTSRVRHAGGTAKRVPATRFRPILREARLLVSGPIGNAFFVHVWTAPSLSSGQCAFVTLDHHATAPRFPSFPNGVMSCSIGPQPPGASRPRDAHPFRYSVSFATRLTSGDPKRWVPPYVQGEVVSQSLHAARIIVSWSGGSHRLALHDGYFAGGSPAMYGHGVSLIAFDAAGRE